jgi:hypothetical protein
MYLGRFSLHAAPDGAVMCGVMASYKHVAPPEHDAGRSRVLAPPEQERRQPKITTSSSEAYFVQSGSKAIASYFGILARPWRKA